MSDDSEVVAVGDNKQPSDLSHVAVGALSKVPFKLLSFIFIIFIFLSSDVFIKRILSNIDGSVGYGNSPTTKGTVITGVLLVLFTAVVQLLIDRSVI